MKQRPEPSQEIGLKLMASNCGISYTRTGDSPKGRLVPEMLECRCLWLNSAEIVAIRTFCLSHLVGSNRKLFT